MAALAVGVCRKTLVLCCLMLLLSLVGGGGARAGDLLVRYPRPESMTDQRSKFPELVLELALAKSGRPFQLRLSELPIKQGRMVTELELGRQIDVMWTMTTIEREARLLPVRIPIDKGLIGCRIGLVRGSESDRYAGVHGLSDLKNVVMAQGHDWPDTEILDLNGLHSETVVGYESLFTMLQRGRIDFLPRSVLEIVDENSMHNELGLAIERHLLLRYPAVQYFFVNRNNLELAEALTTGLKKAMEDGSFDKLFQNFYGPALRDLHLERRRVIAMRNPVLPPLAPSGLTAQWCHP